MRFSSIPVFIHSHLHHTQHTHTHSTHTDMANNRHNWRKARRTQRLSSNLLIQSLNHGSNSIASNLFFFCCSAFLCVHTFSRHFTKVCDSLNLVSTKKRVSLTSRINQREVKTLKNVHHFHSLAFCGGDQL